MSLEVKDEFVLPEDGPAAVIIGGSSVGDAAPENGGHTVSPLAQEGGNGPEVAAPEVEVPISEDGFKYHCLRCWHAWNPPRRPGFENKSPTWCARCRRKNWDRPGRVYTRNKKPKKTARKQPEDKTEPVFEHQILAQPASSILPPPPGYRGSS